MRTFDGRVFRPEEAAWSITLKDGSVCEWSEVALVMMIEPTYDVTHGQFGGMPVRGLRFTDMSDLAVEVPLPLEGAREMGTLLASRQIEVAQSVPSGLVVARRRPLR